MGTKVLIIEDDPLLIKLYKESLSGNGFEVEVATDGRTGLDKINLGGWGLVILDVMLPVMDGLTVLKEAKTETPVIVMTNLTGGAIEKEAISLGAVECIDKTKFKPEMLIEKIKSYLK